MLLTLPELIAMAASQARQIDAVTAYAESRNCESWFIDVREPSEVAAQPIAGSVNIPRGILEMQMLQHCDSADTPIFIHCATSARATLAAEQLQRLGYTQVSVITCSLDAIGRAQDACS